MRIRSVVLVVLLSPAIALAVKPDKPGCKDHPLFPTRMPNYYIAACEAKEFASHPFRPRLVPGVQTCIVENNTRLHAWHDFRWPRSRSTIR